MAISFLETTLKLSLVWSDCQTKPNPPCRRPPLWERGDRGDFIKSTQILVYRYRCRCRCRNRYRNPGQLPKTHGGQTKSPQPPFSKGEPFGADPVLWGMTGPWVRSRQFKTKISLHTSPTLKRGGTGGISSNRPRSLFIVIVVVVVIAIEIPANSQRRTEAKPNPPNPLFQRGSRSEPTRFYGG